MSIASIAKLHFDIDSSGAPKASSELDRLTASTRKAEGAIDGASKGSKRAAAGLGGVGGKAGFASQALSRLAGAFNPLTIGIAAATAGLAGLRASLGVFAEFESQFNNVVTLLDEDSFGDLPKKLGIEKLEQDLLSLSRTSGEALAPLNKGLFDAVSAGVEATKAIGFLNSAVNLAKAGGTNVAISVDGMTSAYNAFGDSAGTATDIAEKFFTAQKFGKTTIDALSNSLGRVAPTAEALGLSLDDTLAAISAQTLGGTKTAEAVTQLNAALTSVLKPSAEAEKLANKLGLAFNSQALEAQGLQSFLKSVADATGGSADMMAELFGSTEATKAVLSLTGAQAEAFSDTLDAIGDSAQRATTYQNALNLKNQELANTYARGGTAVRSLGVAFGDAFKPVVTNFLNPIIDSVGRLLSGEGFRGMLNVMGQILSVAGKLAGTAISFTIDKFRIATEIAYAIVKPFVNLVNYLWGQFKDTTAYSYIQAGFGAVNSALHNTSQQLSTVGKVLSALWGVVNEFASRTALAMGLVGAKTAQVWYGVQADVARALSTALSNVGPVGNKFIGLFAAIGAASKAVWDNMAGLAIQAVSGAANGFIAGFEQMLNFVIRKVNSFSGEVFAMLSKIPGVDLSNFGQISEVELGRVSVAGGEGAIQDVAAAASAAFNQDFLGNISAGLDGLASSADASASTMGAMARSMQAEISKPLSSIQALMNAFSAPSATQGPDEFFGERIGGAAGAAADAVMGVSDAIQGLGSQGGGGGGSLGTVKDDAEAAETAVDKMTNSLKKLFKSFGKGEFKQGLQVFWNDFEAMGRDAIKDLVDQLKDGAMSFADVFKSLGTSLKDTFSGLKDAFSSLTSGGGLKGLLGGLGGAFSSATPFIGALSIGKQLYDGVKDYFKTKVTGSGIYGTISGDGANAGTFTDKERKHKRFWKGTKRWREYSGNASLSDALAMGAADYREGIAEMAASIGASTGDLAAEVLKFSVKGAKQANVEGILTRYANQLAGTTVGLSEYLTEGESSFEGLTRLSGALTGVNGMFEALGFTLYETSLSGASMASSFADLFGGMEEFSAATGSYFDKFYSDQEKFQFSSKALGDQLAELGINTIPMSTAAFRSLVDTAKATGDDELAASLIQLAPEMANVLDQSERLREAMGAGAKDYATLADERLAQAMLINGGPAANDEVEASAVQQAQMDRLIVEVQKLSAISQTALDEQQTEAA